ncbi:NfeD family protein [Halocatena pleomorpha]|uniref:NfeD family protein n=1 Tax=Halocatena pleomorpha TaxID=1785090 RepID=A0A3P3R5Y2_9EURY|nr:NfeD family protein [Halocatena pleomorpha]RRJ28891.1 NfeD family protein [Halocatena pleomorpha]
MEAIVLQPIVEGVSLTLPVLLLLAGAGLLIAEALAPGAHFIVVGIALLAAGIVGIALSGFVAMIPMLIGMVLTVLISGGLSLYLYQQLDIYGGKGSGRTSDSDTLKGKTGRVTEHVTSSNGVVKLDNGGFNPNYQARTLGGEIPPGEEVIVIDPGGGNVITVEALSVIEDEIDRELNLDSEPRNDEREPDTAS